MAITPLPPLPSIETRPDTFDADVESFLGALPQFSEEIDAARAQAVAASEAGATGFPYVFDAATAAADPSSGIMRFNNAVMSSVTAIYLSATASGGAAIGALLDTFDDSTSAQKGLLRVVKSSDPSRWALFKVNSIAAPTSLYRTAALTYVAGPGGFTASDTLAIQFSQVGDRGERGPIGNADKIVTTTPAPSGTVHTMDYNVGSYQVWSPPAGACTLKIINWPPEGTNGELWIEGTNLGACTITTEVALDYLKADGSYATTTSMNTNQGVTLRSAGIDNVLIWGRAGAPKRAKVVR